MKKAIKIVIITLLSLIALITITIAVLFTHLRDDNTSADEPKFVPITPIMKEIDSIALTTNMDLPDSIRLNLEDYDYLVNFVEENYAPFSAIMEKGYEQEYKAMRKQFRQQVINGEANIEKAASDYAFWFFSQFDRHIMVHSNVFYRIEDTLFPQDIEIIEVAPKAVSCKVDSCTWLIRVPSCNPSFGEWTYNAFQQFVGSDCKNLIIDVRSNGGGSDAIWWNCYFAELYDHPNKPFICWFRNTTENLHYWENMLEINPTDAYQNSTTRKFIKKCKTSKKEFIKSFERDGDLGFQPTTRIHRAAVITDSYTASAAESLVGFVKKHSDRTKVYGVWNTFGADQTGNIYLGSLPNSKIKFHYATTVHSDFYDNDCSGAPGIAPDIIIPLPYPKILTDNIDEWVLWVAEDLKR